MGTPKQLVRKVSNREFDTINKGLKHRIFNHQKFNSKVQAGIESLKQRRKTEEVTNI